MYNISVYGRSNTGSYHMLQQYSSNKLPSVGSKVYCYHKVYVLVDHLVSTDNINYDVVGKEIADLY